MSFLIALALRLGIPARFAKIVVFGTLILAVIALAVFVVKRHDRGVIKAHEAEQVQLQQAATEQAATERVNDVERITQSQQETHDVIVAEPDQPISATSRALACARLRNAGRAPPACGGPSSGH